MCLTDVKQDVTLKDTSSLLGSFVQLEIKLTEETDSVGKVGQTGARKLG